MPNYLLMTSVVLFLMSEILCKSGSIVFPSFCGLLPFRLILFSEDMSLEELRPVSQQARHDKDPSLVHVLGSKVIRSEPRPNPLTSRL